MRIRAVHEGVLVEVVVERHGGGLRALLPDGTQRAFQATRTDDGFLIMELEDRTLRIPFTSERGESVFSWGGHAWRFRAEEAVPAASVPRDAGGALHAPMTGVLARVLVSEGERVAAGQPLAVLESMKVMATLESPVSGVVRRINVPAGSQVAQDALLVELEPDR